jgi:hypothetical protein
MSITINSVVKYLSGALAATALLALPMAANAESAQGEAQQDAPAARGVVMTMEAEVIEIDLETRQVSLRGPTGNIVTLTSPEKVERRRKRNWRSPGWRWTSPACPLTLPTRLSGKRASSAR